VVVDGTVYATIANTVLAVDAANGQQRWSFQTNVGIGSPPVVMGKVVYISSGGNLYTVST
jgi:eukaryotic-like serine/threonine-protein kinase